MRVLLLIFLIQLVVVTGLSVFVRETLSVAAGGIGVSIIGALMGLRHLTEARRLKPLAALAVAAGAGTIATLGTMNLPLSVAFECYRSRIGPFMLWGGGARSPGAAPYLLTAGSAQRVEGFVPDSAGRGFRLWSLSRLGRDWSYVAER